MVLPDAAQLEDLVQVDIRYRLDGQEHTWPIVLGKLAGESGADAYDWRVVTPLVGSVAWQQGRDLRRRLGPGGADRHRDDRPPLVEPPRRGRLPGRYLLEPAAPTPEVEPLWLALGAADAPTWEGELPRLEREGR